MDIKPKAEKNYTLPDKRKRKLYPALRKASRLGMLESRRRIASAITVKQLLYAGCRFGNEFRLIEMTKCKIAAIHLHAIRINQRLRINMRLPLGLFVSLFELRTEKNSRADCICIAVALTQARSRRGFAHYKRPCRMLYAKGVQ